MQASDKSTESTLLHFATASQIRARFSRIINRIYILARPQCKKFPHSRIEWAAPVFQQHGATAPSLSFLTFPIAVKVARPEQYRDRSARRADDRCRSDLVRRFGSEDCGPVVLKCRGVAQPGSAPALGAGGRWFESSRPDHRASSSVGLEQRPSKPRVMGSNPFWRATKGSARDAKRVCALCDFRISARVRFGGECSSVGRALDCGSRCRGFNPLHSPHPYLLRTSLRGAPLAQLVEQLTLNQRVPSSSLGRRTKLSQGFGPFRARSLTTTLTAARSKKQRKRQLGFKRPAFPTGEGRDRLMGARQPRSPCAGRAVIRRDAAILDNSAYSGTREGHLSARIREPIKNHGINRDRQSEDWSCGGQQKRSLLFALQTEGKNKPSET
jgi:hypothetical protein